MPRKKAIVTFPFLREKDNSSCTKQAYLEFPRDIIGDKWRSRGLIIIHVAVVVYMFYSLALVCERYFMPSLEEFAQRLNLSDDVAGATLMSAGSSAPELFTAVLGVFIAKGDVGTGAIVGSAVFNILFVIGICAFVTSTATHLNWWPVLRDSIFYTFTVLVLIVIIYDELISPFESLAMLSLYGLYICIMAYNTQLKEYVTQKLLSSPITSKLLTTASIDGADDVFNKTPPANIKMAMAPKSNPFRTTTGTTNGAGAPIMPGNADSDRLAPPSSIMMNDDMFRAVLLLVVQHKRLFSVRLRFQSAARLIIWQKQYKEVRKRRHQFQLQQQQEQLVEASYIGPPEEEDQHQYDQLSKSTYPLKNVKRNKLVNQSNTVTNYGSGQVNQALIDKQQIDDNESSSGQRQRMAAYSSQCSTVSKNKFSLVAEQELEMWHCPPSHQGASSLDYYLWLAKIPVNFVLYHTIPDCSLYPDKYWLTFIISITWTAVFSYIMVWMVTLIGYTLAIPDSIMGITFLAAGTSVPDAYSSIHVARQGMADMAVSNSIGSNIFDILIGLALPWFIQTAIYPGEEAKINSRGVIYSVVLLFMSLVATIYLLNRYNWTLQPRLGLALLIAYGLFLVLTCMLEFNMFGHVNPPPCAP